jgi:MFS family permease
MKKVLKYLVFVDAFVIFGAALFIPIYALFVEELGGTALAAGGAWAAFTFTMGIFMFFVSRWEDTVKHQEKILIGSYGLMAVAAFCLIFVQQIWQLFLVQGLLGIAEAFNRPVFEGIYTKHLDKGKYTSQWGVWSGIGAMLSGVAAIVGGLVAKFYGFRPLFIIMFVVALTGSLLSFKFLKKKKTKKSKPRRKS